MAVDVALVTDSETWNGIVRGTGKTSPFHRYELLRVVADHAGANLYPFVGYDGQEAVGVFPVFETSKGPLDVAFSPPPNLKISYLGPAWLGSEGAKQRKAEHKHRQFVEAVWDEVADRIDPHYVHLRTGVEYTDPRPLLWNGFDATPSYTYVVDISPDAEEVFRSFSSNVRRNVRKARENHEYRLEEGDETDVREVIARVADRHEEQGVPYPVTPAFVADLYRAGTDSVRVYTCRSDGELLGGAVTVEDERTIQVWQTVVDHDSDVPATDVLDWEIIRRAKDRGLTELDLVGANDPRLCRFKAKFNPDVRTFYSLERSSMAVDALKSAYVWLQEARSVASGTHLEHVERAIASFRT